MGLPELRRGSRRETDSNDLAGETVVRIRQWKVLPPWPPRRPCGCEVASIDSGEHWQFNELADPRDDRPEGELAIKVVSISEGLPLPCLFRILAQGVGQPVR